MRKATIAALGAGVLLAGCIGDGGPQGYGPGPGYSSYRGYDYNHPDPQYGGYDPSHYYRPGGRRHRLAQNERVYRGQDGRYYCRRSNGTTGLIVGALAGGLLGNIIAPGGSETLGTLLGAGGGALAGRAVDRNNVECQ